MYEAFAFEEIRALAGKAHGDRVLRGLGAPDPRLLETGSPDASDRGLFALHLGAAFHRRAVIAETMHHYLRRTKGEAGDYESLALVVDGAGGSFGYETAGRCYRTAVSLAPDLAEGHYNLGRICRAVHARVPALGCFDQVLSLEPHPLASPHAYLPANAHFERAMLLEDLGRDHEALLAYRAALRRMSTFGVHHVRLARFFRRMHCIEEAIAEFGKGMGYTHRYFPEFVLPPLVAGDPAPPELQPIYETGRGELVVSWQGAFYAFSPQDWASLGEAVTALSPDQTARARSARSIAALDI